MLLFQWLLAISITVYTLIVHLIIIWYRMLYTCCIVIATITFMILSIRNLSQWPTGCMSNSELQDFHLNELHLYACMNYIWMNIIWITGKKRTVYEELRRALSINNKHGLLVIYQTGFTWTRSIDPCSIQAKNKI